MVLFEADGWPLVKCSELGQFRAMAQQLKLAADIGGTFTDIVLEQGSKRWSGKVLTTTQAPELGVLEGIKLILEQSGKSPKDISVFIHGTTLATNALIERKGAKTAFITTEGFRDVIEQGYEKRFDHYDLMIESAKPLVDRHLRLTIEERLAVNGDVLVPLDESKIPTLAKIIRDENIGAVAGNVKVGNNKNILTKWQSIEYTTAQNFDRRAFDLINAITVVPGAIGAFRKSAIIEAGGFAADTLAEDCDLTIRILRNGHIVRNCPEAIAVTEAPETLRQFMKQRFRWSYGIMQSFWKNRDACFNPYYRGLGMVALPNILLFQIIMPLFGPFADFMFFLGLFINRNNPESEQKILLFYIIFLLVDAAVSIIAFLFEKEKLYKLVWLIQQRFVYRLLMYVVLFRSIRKAIKGENQGWGILKRTGNVVAVEKTFTGQPANFNDK